MYIWLQFCQILTDFNNFCTGETGKKCTKQGLQRVYHSRVKDVNGSVWSPCGANWTSLLWTTPSTSGGVVCQLVSTLKADILNITCQIIMSKWQYCKFDNWRWLFLFSFAVNVNEQRIIAFLTEKCCYLNLRSKVHTQLRWCGKFYYIRM